MAKIETEKRRLAILQQLDATPGYQLNAALLTMGAESQGIPTTSDQMAHALSWLEEAEFVALEEPMGTGLLLAKLTRRGQDIARGKSIVAGVARPGPAF